MSEIYNGPAVNSTQMLQLIPENYRLSASDMGSAQCQSFSMTEQNLLTSPATQKQLLKGYCIIVNVAHSQNQTKTL